MLPIPNDYLFKRSSRAERRRMIEAAYQRHQDDLRLWEIQKEEWRTGKGASSPAPRGPSGVDPRCPSVSILRRNASVQGNGRSLGEAVE